MSVTAPEPLQAPPPWAGEIDAFAAYLRAGGYPATTVYLRRYQLIRVARALGGDPWAVTTDALVAWSAVQDWRPETRRSFRSALRAFYAWARRTGRTSSDPSEILPRVKPSQPDPHPTPADLWFAALEAAQPRERVMLRLAGELGLRRGEVAQVHRRDLYRSGGGWCLIVHGKGDKIRTLPLTNDLAGAVAGACERGGGYAFPGRDNGHLSAARVGRLVSALLPAGWSMHSLRHRFATLAHDHEHNLLAVQELLGHASVETTRRYVRTDSATLRDTVEAISRGGGAGRHLRPVADVGGPAYRRWA